MTVEGDEEGLIAAGTNGVEAAEEGKRALFGCHERTGRQVFLSNRLLLRNAAGKPLSKRISTKEEDSDGSCTVGQKLGRRPRIDV